MSHSSTSRWHVNVASGNLRQVVCHTVDWRLSILLPVYHFAVSVFVPFEQNSSIYFAWFNCQFGLYFLIHTHFPSLLVFCCPWSVGPSSNVMSLAAANFHRLAWFVSEQSILPTHSDSASFRHSFVISLAICYQLVCFWSLLTASMLLHFVCIFMLAFVSWCVLCGTSNRVYVWATVLMASQQLSPTCFGANTAGVINNYVRFQLPILMSNFKFWLPGELHNSIGGQLSQFGWSSSLTLSVRAVSLFLIGSLIVSCLTPAVYCLYQLV